MKRHVCVIAATLLLIPATASAGWWDYFDRLSGCGPFRGNQWYMQEFRIASLSKVDTVHVASAEQALLRDDADALNVFVTVRVRSMTNEEEHRLHPEDPLNSLNVRLTPFDVAVMYRLPHTRGAVDVGAGLTAMIFSGADFNQFTRLGALAKLTVTPLGVIKVENDRGQALLRSLKIYTDVTLTTPFSGADFENKIAFTGDEHLLKRWGMEIDFSTLAYALHR
jgi:hypothetical protein